MFMIDDMYPKEWDKIKLRDIVQRNASEQRPNKSDIPLIIFKRFATDPIFKQYLAKGSVDLLSGAYFAKDMDLAKQKYLVFAVYLWLNFKVKHSPEKDMDVYYDIDYREYTTVDDRVRFSAWDRNIFIRLFKDYIHFDLWDEGDYKKER